MTEPYHTNRSSFSWRSPLTDERKDEIIAWVATFDENQKQMLQEIIDDVEAETYDANDPDL